MKIKVAGAGAGKTTKMAARILDLDIPPGKIVYCVAFTNAATANIKAKIAEENGVVPANVKVSTIHSFLYSEFVHPYYHLLYGTRYLRISTIALAGKPAFRNKQIGELEQQRLLHQTVIPQRAKWVVDGKAADSAKAKALRGQVMALFAGYCHRIIVDEAQDINKEILDVVLALDQAGIDIELSGDPKQDVKGHGCFRQLIDMFPEAVEYSSECHRCPQTHLQISNRLACESERQVADEGAREGSLDVLFEADIDARALIEGGGYGLAYISRRNDRFNTHANDEPDKRLDTLRHHLASAIMNKQGVSSTDLEVKRAAYYLGKKMLAFVDGGGEVGRAINWGIEAGYFDFDKKAYAKMAKALEAGESSSSEGIAVRSIEAVKGLEHDKCLFVLTGDLAPYLMGDKVEDNKTMHLLYVALTRSLDNLAIVVTPEVESKFSREQILAAFGKRST